MSLFLSAMKYNILAAIVLSLSLTACGSKGSKRVSKQTGTAAQAANQATADQTHIESDEHNSSQSNGKTEQTDSGTTSTESQATQEEVDVSQEELDENTSTANTPTTPSTPEAQATETTAKQTTTTDQTQTQQTQDEESKEETVPPQVDNSVLKVTKQTPADPYELRRSTRINSLSSKLLMAQLSEKGLQNTLVSSVSLYYALSMLKNGTAGETEKLLAKKLLSDIGFDQNDIIEKLTVSLVREKNGPTDKLGSFSLANSIWSHKAFNLKQEFLDANEKSFQATHASLDFLNESSVDTINKWVQDSTKELIKEIVDANTLANSLWVLINTAYFEGSWQKEAAKDNLDFKLLDGSSQSVESITMNNTTGKYLEVDTNTRAAQVDFDGGKYSFVVALQETADQKWLKVDGLKILPNVIARLRKAAPTTLKMSLPKMNFGSEVNMSSESQVTSSLGLTPLFTNPNLSRMSEVVLPVGLIRQKTKIELDEKGVKAAAATAVMNYRSAFVAPAANHEIIADKPFLFAIIENDTGAILFNGVVINPKQK